MCSLHGPIYQAVFFPLCFGCSCLSFTLIAVAAICVSRRRQSTLFSSLHYCSGISTCRFACTPVFSDLFPIILVLKLHCKVFDSRQLPKKKKEKMETLPCILLARGVDTLAIKLHCSQFHTGTSDFFFCCTSASDSHSVSLLYRPSTYKDRRMKEQTNRIPKPSPFIDSLKFKFHFFFLFFMKCKALTPHLCHFVSSSFLFRCGPVVTCVKLWRISFCHVINRRMILSKTLNGNMIVCLRKVFVSLKMLLAFNTSYVNPFGRLMRFPEPKNNYWNCFELSTNTSRKLGQFQLIFLIQLSSNFSLLLPPIYLFLKFI